MSLKFHKKAISESEYIKYLGILWLTLLYHGIYILIRFPKQYLELQDYYTKLDPSLITKF